MFTVPHTERNLECVNQYLMAYYCYTVLKAYIADLLPKDELRYTLNVSYLKKEK